MGISSIWLDREVDMEGLEVGSEGAFGSEGTERKKSPGRRKEGAVNHHLNYFVQPVKSSSESCGS